MSDTYANAITSVLGSSAMNNKGQGGTFSVEKIPEIHEFPMITSGCMLVSRNLYEQIHGMDPVFLNGYCDLDFSFKCRQAGYRLYATTKSIVYHRGKVAGAVRLLGAETDGAGCRIS